MCCTSVRRERREDLDKFAAEHGRPGGRLRRGHVRTGGTRPLRRGRPVLQRPLRSRNNATIISVAVGCVVVDDVRRQPRILNIPSSKNITPAVMQRRTLVPSLVAPLYNNFVNGKGFYSGLTKPTLYLNFVQNYYLALFSICTLT